MSSPGTTDSIRGPSPRTSRGPHWIALCAAVCTLPLLFVGGSVTTYRVGLAVPDWPTTFGINMFLYDFWNAPFGVRVEHTHRLYGAAVGLFCVVLAAWFLAFERRRWLKAMGVLALAAVIVQGVLGGTRVTQVSTLLAAVHGSMGQAVFGLMVALCVWTGRDWQTAGPPLPDSGHVVRRSLVLLCLVAAQIMLGSWLRHFGTWAVLTVHCVFALAVWGHAVALLLRVQRERSLYAALRPSAQALALTTSLQVLLGVVSFIYLLPFDGTPRPVAFYQAVARTSHQTNGALVMACAVVLCLRAWKHLSPEKPVGGRARWHAAAAKAPHGKALDWEGVA
jgi:heme a synthase